VGGSCSVDRGTLLFSIYSTNGLIPSRARIWRTVFPEEGSRAIKSRFQLHIDVWICDLIACGPVADHEEDGILLREIQEMMAVARSSWKADSGARPNGFATRVAHSCQLNGRSRR
jgi:hypothetical protein